MPGTRTHAISGQRIREARRRVVPGHQGVLDGDQETGRGEQEQEGPEAMGLGQLLCLPLSQACWTAGPPEPAVGPSVCTEKADQQKRRGLLGLFSVGSGTTWAETTERWGGDVILLVLEC